MKKTCIDPGHPSYFKDTQKINWGCEEDGIKEVELNLKLAEILEKILQERGCKVILTRRDNKQIVSNEDWTKIVEEFGADLFLRIHSNSERHKDSEIRGVKTIYPPPATRNISAKSWEIASSVHIEQ